MEPIKQSAVIIRPGRSYIAWANLCCPNTCILHEDFFKDRSMVVVTPYCDRDIKAYVHIDEMSEFIFTQMLKNWNPDESVWPEDIQSIIFWQWFNVEFVQMAMDSEGGYKEV